MLSAQPLTQPLPGVSLYGPVGFTDWTEAEVVSPPNHHAVERAHHRLLIQQDFVPSGLAADRSTDADHSLLRRYGAQIGPSRFWRVAAPERMSRPGESHPGPLAEPSVKLSPHSAPIRQTRRPYRFANGRREPTVPYRAVQRTGPPGF